METWEDFHNSNVYLHMIRVKVENNPWNHHQICITFVKSAGSSISPHSLSPSDDRCATAQVVCCLPWAVVKVQPLALAALISVSIHADPPWDTGS